MTGTTTGQRGATGVEVALVITLVAVVVLGAVRFLGDGSDEKLTTAKAGIDGEGVDEEGGSGSGGGGASGGGSSGGSTGGGGSGGGTTTTPADPTPTSTTTTAPPTTTTTAAPTTTTTAAPTTTVPPPPASASPSLAPISTELVGWSQWQGTSTVALTGDDGSPLGDAEVEVEVRRRQRRWDGSYRWYSSTVTVTTSPDGTATIPVGPYGRSGNGSVREVEVTVVEVAPPPPTTWDGSQPSRSADAP